MSYNKRMSILDSLQSSIQKLQAKVAKGKYEELKEELFYSSWRDKLPISLEKIYGVTFANPEDSAINPLLYPQYPMFVNERLEEIRSIYSNKLKEYDASISVNQLAKEFINTNLVKCLRKSASTDENGRLKLKVDNYLVLRAGGLTFKHIKRLYFFGYDTEYMKGLIGLPTEWIEHLHEPLKN